MTNRKRRPNGRTPTQLPTDPVLRELKLAADVQAQLTRTQEAARALQAKRQGRVREAFAAGASSKQLSEALGVSRAKIYRLIGSARTIQA